MTLVTAVSEEDRWKLGDKTESDRVKHGSQYVRCLRNLAVKRMKQNGS